MIMVYLDNQPDFMHAFHRAYIAKEIVQQRAPIAEPVQFWTTNSARVELDARNHFLLLEGETVFRFDFIWIANLARFISLDVQYRDLGPDQLVEGVQTYQVDAGPGIGPLSLYLYPWHNFPVWKELQRSCR